MKAKLLGETVIDGKQKEEMKDKIMEFHKYLWISEMTFKKRINNYCLLILDILFELNKI